MQQDWGRCLFWAGLWGLTFGAMSMILSAYADTGSVSADPLLTYMQAAGFPAWAGVVAWGVLRISGEIKAISNKLDAHIMLTERRLSRLEAQAGLLLSPMCELPA